MKPRYVYTSAHPNSPERNHDFAKVEIRQKFYNDPLTEDAWNDFYFWRFHTSPSLDSLDSWDAQVPMLKLMLVPMMMLALAMLMLMMVLMLISRC